MIVLDTNVVSELARDTPDPRVKAWVNARPAQDYCIAIITEAELLAGIAMMPAGKRRDAVGRSVRAIIENALGGRVLPLDRRAAPHFAAMRAARRDNGRSFDAADLLIGAIARAHGAALIATRNTGDFEGCGVKLFDPWAA